MFYPFLFEKDLFMSLLDVANNSQILNQLYMQYDLSSITSQGQLTDKLGDVYEAYVMEIFKDKNTVLSWGNGTIEKDIVDGLFRYLDFTTNDLLTINCSDEGIPPTNNHGMPKTDVYITCNLVNNSSYLIPLSVKQSTAPKVSFAEYSVADIVQALDIQDPRLIYLLEKHQCEASAKNFTRTERDDLKRLIVPHVDNLIRWCITLSPNPTHQNIRHPEYIIKFALYPKNKPNQRYCLNTVSIYDVNQYINSIRYNANGILRTGGFGTGLSWTYATGSKGRKIQFKA